MIESWKARARLLKIETYALYFAYRDPRTPWYAKVWTAFVVGYAFSPIDLIPDFIPVLGYLDDLVLIPLGIWLATKMIPPQVLNESRLLAREKLKDGKPVNWIAAAIIVFIWLATVGFVIWMVIQSLGELPNFGFS